jgi:quercetin dioxygenase-like cupin family protein
MLATGLPGGAAGVEPAQKSVAPAAQTLLTRDLLSVPDKEVTMLTVAYPPSGASLPHRHDAQVLVYVLEGSVAMQIRGQSMVTLKTGDTFYEGPEDVHVVSANASAEVPARFLVVMIKDKNRSASRLIDK